MKILSFFLLKLETTLVVMARFAVVQRKICSGSGSVVSTIVVRMIRALA
jgi:hypothetical protein